MPLIQLSSATLSRAGHVVFDALDWSIEPGERIGLVGPNGSGKSSLLAVLAGDVAPDRGQRSLQRGATVGLLRQDLDFDPGQSLLECALALPPVLAAVEDELSSLEAQLADPAVYGDERRLGRVLARQEDALDRFEALGGASHRGRVVALLDQLGFSEADYHRDAETLSGGEKKLVALAILARSEPDLLLLDEPDNHLDLVAKARLEAFIGGYPGTVIVVSHDRYLLDSVVDRIGELENAALALYAGNYSAYTTEREIRRLAQRRHYAAQQKEIARIEASIRRFELWASLVVNERHIKQARSRRRALARLDERGERIEKVRDSRRLPLSIPGGRGSRKAVEIADLAVGFGDELVFVGLDLLVRHGERIGLVGRNGCGKSVLLETIVGRHRPLEGEVRIGPSTRVGYYAQQHETLEPWRDKTPLELVRDVSPRGEGEAVSFLTRMLFRYDQVRQPIETLSGGERSRLQLARLVLQNPNLLVLDEPTNNLDIPAAEVLEAALEDFEGALLVVSHDRYFLDRTVDRIVELEDGALEVFEGGYTDHFDAKAKGRDAKAKGRDAKAKGRAAKARRREAPGDAC